MRKENCLESGDNTGFYDEGGNDYDIGIADKDTVVCHKCGGVPDKCHSKNNTKERRTKMKIIEIVISAALALLTAAKYFIKFINYLNDLNDLKHQTA